MPRHSVSAGLLVLLAALADLSCGPEVPKGLVNIEPGTFRMGSPSTESGRDPNEGPEHQVTISKGFYMGRTEVTQAQYQAVMGTNPSWFKGENRPVEQVSWYDAARFCNGLSASEGLTPCYDESDWNCNFSANGYRLPTEAEWEYACRAGTTGPFHTGSCLSAREANYDGEYPYSGCPEGRSRGKTWAVGSGAMNALELSDMHGNVMEWCWDSKASYPPSSAIDPRGPSTGSTRVVRGGSWSFHAWVCRSAFRNFIEPSYSSLYVGFRVVRAD